MKSALNYLLKAFGFCDLYDFNTTVFKFFYLNNLKVAVPLVVTAGTVREFIETSLGMNLAVIIAFVWLIIAEFQTGVKASLKKKNERVKSRKIGRMILKIGVYIQILFILHSFAANIQSANIVGFEVNPFEWLYYIVFAGIIFQMVISYLENLSILGYSEAKGLHGAVLRKFNTWFEFDGSKDADNFDNQNQF